jgi:hypothetical protein
VTAEREALVGEEGRDVVVGQLGPLELEEEQLVADGGAALLDTGQQCSACGVGDVDREAETGVRAGLAHGVGELGGVEPANPSAETGERLRALGSVVEHGVDTGVATAVDKRIEVPRDVERAEVGLGRGHVLITSFQADWD